MRITVLGCGTSMGVPAIGCSCGVCREGAPKNQRLRASILVETRGKFILVDCGTDFRAQALRHRIPRIDAVLLTHDHADHVNGMDDLRAYNFLQRAPIPIYGLAPVLATVRQRHAYCFEPSPYGAIPQLDLRPVEKVGPIVCDGVSVIPVPIFHGEDEILGFRFGSFAYLTDCSRIPESSFPLLRGLESLVLSALRVKPHPKHFTVEEACRAALQIGARRTYLTHMTCALDYARDSRNLPEGIQFLYDGLTLETEEA
jgi:phosphoribosyl 1,2-cyclic phosphate phosphodiesterase